MLENKIYNKNNRTKIKRKGNIQYTSKDYVNPFFTERKKSSIKKEFNWKIYLLTTIPIFLFLFIIWFLLYSPIFAIFNIVVDNNQNEIQQLVWDEINYKRFAFSPKNNIIFLNKKSLKDKIEEKYSFDQLNIHRKDLHTITITYTERQLAFIWLEDGKYYNVDRSGYLISETTSNIVSQLGLPIVENKSTNKIDNKKIALGVEYIDFMFLLADKFKEYPEFIIQKYIISNTPNMVNAKLVDGPEIYFSMNIDIKKQLNKLTTVKNEKLKDNFKTVIYIDVSVGDSVYYR